MTYKTGDWVQVKKENPAGKRYKVKSHWTYERNGKTCVRYALEGNHFLQEDETLEPAEIRVGDKVCVKSLSEILDWAEEEGYEPRVSYPIGMFCGGFYLVDDVLCDGICTLLGVKNDEGEPILWNTEWLELVTPCENVKTPVKVKVRKKRVAPIKAKVRRIEKNKDHDAVNHPSHYTSGGVECIDAMESAFGKEAVYWFCVCNAFKYVWRHKKKNGVEDLKKAQWYENKAKELSEQME